ncbi:hypothetical protein BDN70DRAFT_919053 [Pholiota conissans]|uniref:Uncharacterized protein n=1 Tax=Pholiota conissans TaxID=109636 RepID=A0A9P6D4E9_9AGAR|nr:hypothetical protein BDN70DRAFT_919053 [Pholiota conissans]
MQTTAGRMCIGGFHLLEGKLGQISLRANRVCKGAGLQVKILLVTLRSTRRVPTFQNNASVDSTFFSSKNSGASRRAPINVIALKLACHPAIDTRKECMKGGVFSYPVIPNPSCLALQIYPSEVLAFCVLELESQRNVSVIFLENNVCHYELIERDPEEEAWRIGHGLDVVAAHARNDDTRLLSLKSLDRPNPNLPPSASVQPISVPSISQPILRVWEHAERMPTNEAFCQWRQASVPNGLQQIPLSLESQVRAGEAIMSVSMSPDSPRRAPLAGCEITPDGGWPERRSNDQRVDLLSPFPWALKFEACLSGITHDNGTLGRDFSMPTGITHGRYIHTHKYSDMHKYRYFWVSITCVISGRRQLPPIDFFSALHSYRFPFYVAQKPGRTRADFGTVCTGHLQNAPMAVASVSITLRRRALSERDPGISAKFIVDVSALKSTTTPNGGKYPSESLDPIILTITRHILLCSIYKFAQSKRRIRDLLVDHMYILPWFQSSFLLFPILSGVLRSINVLTAHHSATLEHNQANVTKNQVNCLLVRRRRYTVYRPEAGVRKRGYPPMDSTPRAHARDAQQFRLRW